MLMNAMRKWWVRRLIHRAQVCLDAEYWLEAGELAEEAAKAAPDNATAKMMLGIAKFNAKDYNGAAQSFAGVLEIEPDNAEAKRQLALAYARQKRWDKAGQAAAELAEGVPGSSHGSHVIRGDGPSMQEPPDRAPARSAAEMVKQGDWAALKASAEAGLAKDPSSATALLRLGMALYRLGEPEQALKIYDRTLEAVNKNADKAVVNFNRSTVLMQLGRWQGAGETLESLTLLPADSRGKLREESILYNLAYCYRKRKMIKMAQATYEELRDIDPTYKDVGQCLKRLRVPLAASVPLPEGEIGSSTCGSCDRPLPLGATFCTHCGWSAASEDPVAIGLEV